MNWKIWIAIGALVFLGVMLFFSASAFFNMILIPKVVTSLSADNALAAKGIIVLIALIAALIAGFFSVFLFEMLANWRPWLSGVLFSLPLMGLSVVFARIGGLSMDVALLYAVQFVAIALAYMLMAYLGNAVGRRFFASRVHVDETPSWPE